LLVPNGNRTNTGYATGTNNELLCDGTYTYSYDGEGNRTARWVNNNSGSESSPQPNDTDITIYTWDNRDRLTSVTHYANYAAYQPQSGSPTPDMTVTYTYDIFNRWIGETITHGGTTIQTRYVYDGDQIVMQFDGTGSGSLAATNLSDRYLWGAAVDQLMADEHVTNGLSQTGTVVWTLTDNENTVRDLATYSTGTATVVNHRVYDSFGNLTSQTNAAVDCLFGFAGMAYDQASETNVTPTRRYDPATGRWDSPDTGGFGGGDTNLYRYCGNRPATFVDPSGLSDCDSSHGEPNANTIMRDLEKLQNGFWLVIPVNTNDRGFAGGIGHAWIALIDTASWDPGSWDPEERSTVTARGFGPKGSAGLNNTVPGKITDQAKTQYESAVAIPITLLQYQQLLDAIKADETTPPRYNSASSNCAGWAAKMLGMILKSVQVPADTRLAIGGLGPTPSTIASIIPTTNWGKHSKVFIPK
jgi:RHS repeat-associated protein